jgi:hypothetical protein
MVLKTPAGVGYSVDKVARAQVPVNLVEILTKGVEEPMEERYDPR